MNFAQRGGSKGKNFLKSKTTIKAKLPLGKSNSKKPTPNLGLVLPEGPSDPISDLSQYTILLFGEKKIGKTSTAAKFPKAIFMKTEPGGKGLRITQVPPDPRKVIQSWEEFEGYTDLIIASDKYKNLVIDTVDIAYELCMIHVCDDLNIVHPNDLGYGQGWDAVKKEFKRVMDKLITSGKGVIFISHADDKEFLKPSGTRYNKLIPTMAKAAQKYASGIADIIAYYGYYGDKRFITISGSDTLESGHRLEEHFLTPKGEAVHSIPMGKNAQEGYDNFVKAFNNKQDKVYNLNPEETGLTDVRAPFAKKK